MADIAFVDVESTGLTREDEPWEVAIIRRAPDGQGVGHWIQIEHDESRALLLPETYLADYRARWTPATALSKADAAAYIRNALIGRPHLCGAMPWFDAWMLETLLTSQGFDRVPWHYHLIDIESRAIGWLAAQGTRVDPPWTSDEVSKMVGVNPAEFDRHTALGDARWAMAVYDATGGAPTVGG